MYFIAFTIVINIYILLYNGQLDIIKYWINGVYLIVFNKYNLIDFILLLFVYYMV